MPRTQRERRELRAILPTIQSDRSDQHGHSGTRSPVPAVVVLAFAAWAGCAIGSTLASAGQPVLDRLDTALLMAGGATAAIGLHATRRRRGAAPVPLAITGVAIAVLGGGWSVLRMESDRHAIEAIAASCASERTLVRFEGIVSTPVRGSSPGDRLHAFFRRPPRATFEVDLVSIGPADRAWSRAVAGRVKVSLQDGAASWQVGDLVAATGWLVLERPEANPGQRPPMRASLEPMRLGLIEVPSAGLVEVDERTPSFVRDPWRSLDRIRFAWRHRSRALLESMLGSPEDRRSVDLLRAILLGDRGGEGYRDLRPGFAASGLAHFLAISGFNLAVITVLASIAARALGVRPRRRGLAMIVAIALYILAIPAQLPVLRAGLSALLLAIGLLLARRWDGRAATALAALALLALAPGESIEPGFQLSFAAVFALQELSPRLRRRWFGEPDHLGRSTRSILGSRAADAVSACVAAWAVSTPIALHHFGMAALLGVPATLLATPIVAATISLAAVAMPIASIAPGTSPISGSILLALGDALLAVADAVAAVPHASWRTSPPAAAATLIVLSASICWLAARRRRASFAACAAVGAIMAIALPPPAPADTIEVTMLSVGDGTAIIVRRGHRAALIDVGSVGDRRAGGTIAIRAIESLGIRTLDAVLTSHPNLDHYSGLVEVLAQHREARWFVGEAFVQAATSRPDGPEAAALRTADRLGRVPGIISAGDQIELGGLVVGCLHPPPGESFDTANDASLVLRIDGYEPGDGTGSCRPILLTTGDLEEAGLARASMAIDALDPWVAEVPHHGSATRATARLVVSKPRTVWLQSTGRRRLEPDTLADLLSEAKGAADLPEVRRFVTARDGAISARFAPERGRCESRGWRLESLAVHSGRWIAISEPAQSGSATRAGADPAPDRAAPREAR